jgi:predicted NUDIX family NTP pyrophosphohydrolase
MAGPFWRNKDAGARSIPKGEIEPAEDPAEAAQREFLEELGIAAGGPLRTLGEIRQRGGKRVTAFAIEGNLDTTTTSSNTFEMEWPPKSERRKSFSEVAAQNGSTYRARRRSSPANNLFLNGLFFMKGRFFAICSLCHSRYRQSLTAPACPQLTGRNIWRDHHSRRVQLGFGSDMNLGTVFSRTFRDKCVHIVEHPFVVWPV